MLQYCVVTTLTHRLDTWVWYGFLRYLRSISFTYIFNQSSHLRDTNNYASKHLVNFDLSCGQQDLVESVFEEVPTSYVLRVTSSFHDALTFLAHHQSHILWLS